MTPGGKGGKGPGPGGGGGGGLSGSSMGMIALFAGLVLVLGGIAVADQMGWLGSSGATECDGLTGESIHEHATLKVFLNSSQPYDFTKQKYQVQAGFVHFEGGDGTTVHIHERRPSVGCLFNTLGWQVSSDRIVTDTGQVYAEDATHELKVLVKKPTQDSFQPAQKGFETPLVGNWQYRISYEYTGDASTSNETNTSSGTARTLGLLAPVVAVPALRKLR